MITADDARKMATEVQPSEKLIKVLNDVTTSAAKEGKAYVSTTYGLRDGEPRMTENLIVKFLQERGYRNVHVEFKYDQRDGDFYTIKYGW